MESLIIVFLILLGIGVILWKWIVPSRNTRIEGTSGGPNQFTSTEKMNDSYIVLRRADNIDCTKLVGKVGITTTALKPSGKALIDGLPYNVEADNQFINENEKIIVIGINGPWIKVTKE